MAGFARLIFIAFVVLSVLYFALYYHFRASKRDRLRAEWAEQGEGDQDSFVVANLNAYEGGLRRRLILGVYILPLVVMLSTIYFTNFH